MRGDVDRKNSDLLPLVASKHVRTVSNESSSSSSDDEDCDRRRDGGERRRSGTTTSPSSGGVSSWQAAASVAKAVMGAGSFALPWAFQQTGYLAGPSLLLILMGLSVASLRTLVRCRRLAAASSGSGSGGTKTSPSYVDVARAAFGERGATAAYGASVSASVGVCGSYLVFVAANLSSILDGTALSAGQTFFVWAVLPLAVLLSSVRDVTRFALASTIGDVSVVLGMLAVVLYGALYGGGGGRTFGEGCVAFAPVESMPLAFGAVGFLFFIHFLILPIEASMKRPQDFDQMVILTFLGCALLSAAFGVLGYLFFGEGTEQIVILNLEGSTFVTIVKVLLCVDLLFTYPVVMRPSIEIVERTAVASLVECRDGYGRLAVCMGLGLVAAGASLCVPAFALLSGLVGGVSQTFLGFVMPPLMVQRLQRRKRVGWLECTKTAVIVLFGVVMILWTIRSTWGELRRSDEKDIL